MLTPSKLFSARSTAALALLIVGCHVASASTALFLGQEYQDQSGPNAGTIRGGDPASDPSFTAWLATAGLTTANISSTLGSGPSAVWGKFTTPATLVSSYNYTIGATTITASISGWNDNTNSPAASTGAALSTFGLNSTILQAGAPRPGFASGSGSGYYLGTDNGATSDGIRNGVLFDLSGFNGGGVYSFGIFGGDLETGAPGSPFGFLLITFTDNSTEIINYNPDATLFPDAAWSTGNNISETYGNETSRFIGISNDTKLIKSALFVVGDDDLNDDGDSEQLSFIGSGITFLDASGNPYQPMSVPEPAGMLLCIVGGLSLMKRRRA